MTDEVKQDEYQVGNEVTPDQLFGEEVIVAPDYVVDVYTREEINLLEDRLQYEWETMDLGSDDAYSVDKQIRMTMDLFTYLYPDHMVTTSGSTGFYPTTSASAGEYNPYALTRIHLAFILATYRLAQECGVTTGLSITGAIRGFNMERIREANAWREQMHSMEWTLSSVCTPSRGGILTRARAFLGLN